MKSKREIVIDERRINRYEELDGKEGILLITQELNRFISSHHRAIIAEI